MLTKKQLKEIREHLQKAQNPLFFFHNDPDGLCSFLLLRRWIGRGKGVAVKGSAVLTEDYFRKVRELEPDYIFVLDVPGIEKEFFDQIGQINLPVVWIDHHEVSQEIPSFVDYYNSFKKGFGEPVTFVCQEIANKKEDLWLAVSGCISDKYLPPFYEDFLKDYPELGIESDSPFEILYESGIGRLTKILDFSLMNRTSDVVKMLKYMVEVKGPYDVLQENKKNSFMHVRYNELEKKKEVLMEKARKIGEESDKIIFFKYESDLSMSTEISNRLSYLFSGKYIIVARIRGGKVAISARGDNVREIILKAIEHLPDATGGGHRDAVGAKISLEDWDKFEGSIISSLQ